MGHAAGGSIHRTQNCLVLDQHTAHLASESSEQAWASLSTEATGGRGSPTQVTGTLRLNDILIVILFILGLPGSSRELLG